MYKVFFNEKSISITNTKKHDVTNFNYLSNSNFAEFWKILNSNEVNDICLYSPNVENLWGIFKENFKIVKAAGGLVKNKENKYLFIFRLGKWDLPKGKIEENESSNNAAIREVEEECGISNLVLRDKIITTYHIYTSKKGNLCLKPTYWYDMEYNDHKKPKPQTEEGISKVDWKNIDEIKLEVLSNTFENIKLVLDYIK